MPMKTLLMLAIDYGFISFFSFFFHFTLAVSMGSYPKNDAKIFLKTIVRDAY